jgi:hypothetical protein
MPDKLTKAQSVKRLAQLVSAAKEISARGAAAQIVEEAYKLGLSMGHVMALSGAGRPDALRCVTDAELCVFVSAAGAAALAKFLTGKLDVDKERKRLGVRFFAWVADNKKSCCTQYASDGAVRDAPFQPTEGSVKMESCEQDAGFQCEKSQA